MSAINVGFFQKPEIKFTRSEDKVVVTSGNAQFTCTYLELYALQLWLRTMLVEKEALPLVIGDISFIFDMPNGVTPRQRVQEFLDGMREFLPAPIVPPRSYTWDNEELIGSDSEHIYLRRSVTTFRVVFALHVTLPVGLSRDDSLGYLQHAKETILEGRPLPKGTEDISMIHERHDATPTFLGINKRKIFDQPVVKS